MLNASLGFRGAVLVSEHDKKTDNIPPLNVSYSYVRVHIHTNLSTKPMEFLYAANWGPPGPLASLVLFCLLLSFHLSGCPYQRHKG